MKRKNSLRFKKKIKKLVNDKGLRNFYVSACLQRVNYNSRNALIFKITNVKRAEHYNSLHYFKKRTNRKQEYVYGLGLNGPVKVPIIRGCR